MKLNYTRRMQILEIGKISSIPTQQKYVLSVERQQKIKEELFLYLLNKREENALSLATADSNLRIVDKGLCVRSGRSKCISCFIGCFFWLVYWFPV